jgi:hypothetical protein
MAPLLLLPQQPVVLKLLIIGSIHFGYVQCELYTHMRAHTHTDLIRGVRRRKYDLSEPPENG